MTKKAIETYLEERSIEICDLNNCTEDDHFCESYGYIAYDRENNDYQVIDVCGSDYFQGWGSEDHKNYGCLICVPLPFDSEMDDILDYDDCCIED